VIGLRKTLILIALFLVLIISSLAVYYINRDSDNDGIPDIKEKEYGTDPNKPNYLLAYALKKLPENEALKFKDVDFNESSKELVDLYASLPQDKRNSKEVNMILDNILSDNRVDEIEKNLFNDKFVNPTLPTIDNLSWVPTRENLDKIYDINVTFVARDDRSPIAYAELRFIPVEYYYMIEKYGMRSENYPKVFPPDKERVFVLTPVDGKFDSLEERFSVPIKDIVGGREYRIVVLVKDSAGNERTAEVKTPYIRQFENIAKKDDITVITPYYLWYRKDLSNWRDGHKYMPLLGEYRSDDPIVMSKHIDWATGHGVDGFLVSWGGYEEGDLKYFDDNFQLFLSNPLSKDIRVAILYESVGRLKDSHPGWNFFDPENTRILDSDLFYLNRSYFNQPSFLRIDGKPLVYFYEGKGVFGDISRIENLREKYKIFFVSDHAHPLADPENVFPAGNPLAVVWGKAAKKFDGITSWLGGYSPKGEYLGGSYENQIEIAFSKWEKWAEENGMRFFPFITPEFDNRYVKWGNPNSVPLERSPELFEKRIMIALKYAKDSTIIIGTWNDFFESTTLEPTREYGFTYLEILRDVLRGG
jgi:hypothetical protein